MHPLVRAEWQGMQRSIVIKSGLPGVKLECDFFFQAEDGIRDLTVTGVQTCALPILGVGTVAVEGERRDRGCAARQRPRDSLWARDYVPCAVARDVQVSVQRDLRGQRRAEIGRASCRERV